MEKQPLVKTPAGESRLTRYPAHGRRRALLALGHGAGGGVEAEDLQALAAALPADGVEVALVEQPWRVAGRRLAPAPKTVDVGWVAGVELLPERGAKGASGDVPLIVGGRSAGARGACRTGRATRGGG